MTEKLYEVNSYVQNFTARVVSCTPVPGGFAVVLDRTAFFPEGGGQPCDTGRLGGARVLAVHTNGETITHTTDTPLTAGETVDGCLDWPARLDAMQQHTGEHILSGALHRLFGAENVGFHIGSPYVRMDTSIPLTQEQLAQAEAEANAALQAGINASTAEKATVSNETAGTTENTNNGGQTSNNNNQGGNTPAPTPAPAPTPQPPAPAPAPTPSAPSQSVDGGSVVSRAYSKLGCAYSWGGIGPNSFDCSGFVSYCLTGRYCRLGTTGTFMGWTRVSDPQPGDVVVNSYHTGIYIGGGQMIHASDYNTGVIISSVAAGMNNNYIFVRY